MQIGERDDRRITYDTRLSPLFDIFLIPVYYPAIGLYPGNIPIYAICDLISFYFPIFPLYYPATYAIWPIISL